MKSESEFRKWNFLSPLTEEVKGTEALLEVFMQVEHQRFSDVTSNTSV